MCFIYSYFGFYLLLYTTLHFTNSKDVVHPLNYDLLQPTEPFYGRKDEMTVLKWMHYDNRYVVITGFMGIGKSEFARLYAQEYIIEHGGNVIWIDCHNTTRMVQSFKGLAKRIGLFNLYTDLTKITAIMFYVFKYFEKKETLFIFDGAKVDNDVIPDIRYNYVDNKMIKVIVTSRQSEGWGKEYYVIKLDRFKPSESTLFMTNCFETFGIHVNYEHYEKLIVLLDNIPKALNYTCLYIKDQNRRTNFRVEDFINEFTHYQQYNQMKDSIYNKNQDDYNKFTKFFEQAILKCIFEKVVRPFDVNWIDVGQTYVDLVKLMSKGNIRNETILSDI